jgi:hypothetical protein
MSIIFVVLSRMSPTLEFEYHECEARVVFSSVGDMSENTTKVVYLTLTKSGRYSKDYLRTDTKEGTQFRVNMEHEENFFLLSAFR